MHTKSLRFSVLLLLLLILGITSSARADMFDEVQGEITVTVTTLSSNVSFTQPGAGAEVEIPISHLGGPYFHEIDTVPPPPFPAMVEYDNSAAGSAEYAMGQGSVILAQRKLSAQGTTSIQSAYAGSFYEAHVGGGSYFDIEYTGSLASTQITITADWSYSIDYDNGRTNEPLEGCDVSMRVDLREYDEFGDPGGDVLGTMGDFSADSIGPELWVWYDEPLDEGVTVTNQGTTVWTYNIQKGTKYVLTTGVEVFNSEMLVPEPATLGMLVLGGLVLLRRRS